MIDPNQYDHFVLRQRIRLVINQYEFFLSENDKPFCFVEQARFKFKEDIRFYADASKTTELMRIQARQVFDPWATYDVTAAGDGKIGEQEGVINDGEGPFEQHDQRGEDNPLKDGEGPLENNR